MDRHEFIKRIRQYWERRIKTFEEIGGEFVYLEADGPLDEATYDDPTLPRPRRPIVDDDLEGWEPLR